MSDKTLEKIAIAVAAIKIGTHSPFNYAPCSLNDVEYLLNRIYELEKQAQIYKAEITDLNRALREKNLALDALHWVWCSGGCERGAHRFHDEPLTEEIVALAERNTRRLREYFQNRQSRIANDAARQREET